MVRRRLIGGLALVFALSAGALGVWPDPASAKRVSDVRNTKHNLSTSGPGPVRASPTQAAGIDPTQVCVFCHTPHSATTGVTPLWNRKLSGATYTPYTSSSLAEESIRGALAGPAGGSKLCLSCHDGTIAIGNVNVFGGQSFVSTPPTQEVIVMEGVAADKTMPPGPYGATTGFTRNLGVDLRNDHPISVTFDNTLVQRNGELQVVDANQAFGTYVGLRNTPPGNRPTLPLEPTGSVSGAPGQIQCPSCHDPHIREDSTAALDFGKEKFLRAQRFQMATPTASFNAASDIICLYCHDKNKNDGGGAWAKSVHANPTDADETYKDAAADLREFPRGIRVWEAACLNCHDPHTVQGSWRLLREGTEDSGTPKSGLSNKPAIEETCYQCHRASGETANVLNAAGPTNNAPDIRSQFLKTYHMPITSAQQQNAATQIHDIGDVSKIATGGNWDQTYSVAPTTTDSVGANFVEKPQVLGFGSSNLTKRHAECTDCHNPHRIIKNSRFDGTGIATQATHRPQVDGNTASGALKGAFGVEIASWEGTAFGRRPSNFSLRCGGIGAANPAPTTCTTTNQVAREYQVCLKCHSNFAYSDNSLPEDPSRPKLGDSGGTTPGGTPTSNNLVYYTNQGMEFQPPAAHKRDVTLSPNPPAADSGGGIFNYTWATNNHRSWHPVIDNTGRTTAERGGMASTNFVAPWDGNIGNQTMYCSDCHGSETAGDPSGPHGSSNPFILKGPWNVGTGSGSAAGVCFNCHNSDTYRGVGNQNSRSGFTGIDGKLAPNGHWTHNDRIQTNGIKCTWCHVAVPHGWKNKAFLVNLNDVGPEVMCRDATDQSKTRVPPAFTTGCTIGQPMPQGTRILDSALSTTGGGYTNPPYYLNARNKVVTWQKSGQWTDSNCGNPGGLAGKDWMRSVCDKGAN